MVKRSSYIAAKRTPLSTASLSLLALSLLALPGCQAWNAWLDMLKVPVASKNPAPKPPGTQVEIEPQIAGGGPSVPALIPRVTVYRIIAPLGTFSGNDQVWSELNEDALDSKTSVLLAQNGLRAGVGNISHWPAIQKLVDVPGAVTDPFVAETDGHSSLSIATRPGIPEEIVVSIDRDLEQQGRTFDHADNGFRLSLSPVRAKPELIIQLEPIVTLGAPPVAEAPVQLNGHTINRASGITSEEAFPDLQIATALNAQQFFLLAPVDPKSSRFSVGTLWLSDMEKVPATETVLIFVPGSPPK